jgi:hypothetical protein
MLSSVTAIGNNSTEARVIAGVKLLEIGGVDGLAGRTRATFILLG